MTRRVALTGGIATGKSYVREAFDRLGVPTIDADTLAREAVGPDTRLAQVVERFGRGVLAADGGLDRKKLASVVFADPAARRDLEAIVHPYVREAIDRWFDSLPAAAPFGVADIPLLFETGRQNQFDAVVVVTAEPATQLRRLRERGLSEAEARARMEAQLPMAAKAGAADFQIRTDGTYEETDRQVEDVVSALRAPAPR